MAELATSGRQFVMPRMTTMFDGPEQQFLNKDALQAAVLAIDAVRHQ